MPQQQMRSLLEVRQHLSGDRIPCLICGKHFRSVCHHARLAHGISAREYKQRFGLPVTRGVATPEARAVWAKSIQATIDAGKIKAPKGPELFRPTPPPYAADMRRIGPEAIDQIIEHLKAGMTITDACKMPGLPRWTWVHAAMARDSALQDKFDAAIEALPFAQQARMKKLGARFAKAVAAHTGKTALAVSKVLGVSEEAVRRQINRNKNGQ